jgi:hypothetical protein
MTHCTPYYYEKGTDIIPVTIRLVTRILALLQSLEIEITRLDASFVVLHASIESRHIHIAFVGAGGGRGGGLLLGRGLSGMRSGGVALAATERACDSAYCLVSNSATGAESHALHDS